MCRASTTRSARMLRACPTKCGCCTASTIILFEQPRPGSNRRQLAALLGRVLRRLEKIAPAVSPGRAHRAQHAQQKRRTRRLLENARGRLSLAHRNPSHPRKAQQVVQHQRGVLQLDAARNSRRTIACAGSRIHDAAAFASATFQPESGGIISSLVSLVFIVVLCAVLYIARGPHPALRG